MRSSLTPAQSFKVAEKEQFVLDYRSAYGDSELDAEVLSSSA